MSEIEDLIGSVPERKNRSEMKAVTETQVMIERVSELTQMGLTQKQVGDRLGISQPRVSQLLKRARDEWRQNMTQSYDDYVASEMEHYRILLKALEAGVHAGSWKHVETAIKLAERRSRLIGLDHSDRMEEARVRIEAAQLDLMSRAFNVAMDAIGANEEQRRLATEAMLLELEGGA